MDSLGLACLSCVSMKGRDLPSVWALPATHHLQSRLDWVRQGKAYRR
jgi:hypothetical protein